MPAILDPGAPAGHALCPSLARDHYDQVGRAAGRPAGRHDPHRAPGRRSASPRRQLQTIDAALEADAGLADQFAAGDAVALTINKARLF